MLNMLNYILWDVRPEIFSTDYVTIRWYGLLFASGFLIGQWIIARIFKIEGKPEKDLESLMIYMVLATIVGARLGHCLFYQPDHYLSNPIEILYIWEGGLASHGAAIGILLALYLYSRKRPGQSFLWVVDRIVIVVALGGSFIRFGNLMNSEIIGKPSDMATSFVFAHSLDEAYYSGPKQHVLDVDKAFAPGKDTTINDIVHTPIDITVKFDKNYVKSDPTNPYHQQSEIVNRVITGFRYPEVKKHYYVNDETIRVKITEDRKHTVANFKAWAIPRHPAQLYESISSFLIFLLLLWLYSRKKANTPEGLLFGTFMIAIFSLRFIYEFFKENQVAFEDNLSLNMGQILSIPAILFGVIVLVYALRRPKINPTD